VNSPPPKPEVILTNFFAEPTVLLVPITSHVREQAYFPRKSLSKYLITDKIDFNKHVNDIDIFIND
jgi:hypothetical protein